MVNRSRNVFGELRAVYVGSSVSYSSRMRSVDLENWIVRASVNHVLFAWIGLLPLGAWLWVAYVLTLEMNTQYFAIWVTVPFVLSLGLWWRHVFAPTMRKRKSF